MYSFVHDLNPRYRLPSRKTIRKIMRAMHGKARELMLQWTAPLRDEGRRPYAREGVACLSLDGWSSRANRHYMAFLLHTLDEDFNQVRCPTAETLLFSTTWSEAQDASILT